MSLHCKLVPVQYREYDINFFLMIFARMSFHCKLVPVQYREYGIHLFLMIFPHTSLHCKLVPVQYREYDINLFLMIFPHTSLHCKLVQVQYREYDVNLFLMTFPCMSQVSSKYGTWYSERVILQFMCVGSLAGVTYLRYTVLMSSNKSETAVHCCDPALSVLVMLVSFWLIRSLVDPSLAVFIVCSPLQLINHLWIFGPQVFSDPILCVFKHGTGHVVECLNV